MRRYSSSRSLSDATSMKPIGANPVAWPVSASRRLKRAREYLRISVEVSEVEPKVTIRPAACQVVPEVSRSRSSRTTSFQPIRARWYATEVPMTPPPTTTTRACAGMLAGVELAAVTASVRGKMRSWHHPADGACGFEALLASSVSGRTLCLNGRPRRQRDSRTRTHEYAGTEQPRKRPAAARGLDCSESSASHRRDAEIQSGRGLGRACRVRRNPRNPCLQPLGSRARWLCGRAPGLRLRLCGALQ